MTKKCLNMIDKLKQEGKINEKDGNEYKKLCEADESTIKAKKITQVSYNEILVGVLGGFVFVLALIFKDLITNSVISILPEMELYYTDLILIGIFLLIVFLLVFLRFKANQTDKKLTHVMELRQISF